MGRRYLTEEGIQLIREFLFNNGIKEVDIQIEFLDHYAVLIEEELNKDRSLQFSQALILAHRKAGGSDMLRKTRNVHIKALNTYWSKRIRSFMKGYFEWPKIVIFFAIALFFFGITYNNETLYNTQTIFTGIAFTLLSSVTLAYIIYRRLRLYGLVDKNQLCTYNTFRGRLQFTLLLNVNVFMQLWTRCDDWFPNNEIPAIALLAIMSCISSYELLLAHAFETQFQFWIIEELENKYPEHIYLIRT